MCSPCWDGFLYKKLLHKPPSPKLSSLKQHIRSSGVPASNHAFEDSSNITPEAFLLPAHIVPRKGFWVPASIVCLGVV
jgi:hypothetical protein